MAPMLHILHWCHLDGRLLSQFFCSCCRIRFWRSNRKTDLCPSSQAQHWRLGNQCVYDRCRNPVDYSKRRSVYFLCELFRRGETLGRKCSGCRIQHLLRQTHCIWDRYGNAGCLWLFLKKTKIGISILAVAEDETGAMLMGVDIKKRFTHLPML